MKRKFACLFILMAFTLSFCACSRSQKTAGEIRTNSAGEVSGIIESSPKAMHKTDSSKTVDSKKGSSKDEPLKSQKDFFNYVKQSLDTLAEKPDQFPLRDSDMYGKKKFMYDAVVECYDGWESSLQKSSQKEGGTAICRLLRVEDITDEFREKYGDTQEYSPDCYYCNAYQINADISSTGICSYRPSPVEYAVYKDTDGKWVAVPARG